MDEMEWADADQEASELEIQSLLPSSEFGPEHSSLAATSDGLSERVDELATRIGELADQLTAIRQQMDEQLLREPQRDPSIASYLWG